MNKLLPLLAIAVLWIFCLGPLCANADELKGRTGFLIGFDVGGGAVSFDGDQGGAFMTAIKIGGGLNERILLLAEMTGLVTKKDTNNLGGLFFSSQFFLMADNNFYVRPGAGFANVEIDHGSFGDSTEAGLSFLTALGYEFRLTSRFALSPEFKFIYARIEGGDYLQYGAVADLRWYF